MNEDRGREEINSRSHMSRDHGKREMTTIK